MQDLIERVEKLERLVEIISRGKYQWESTFDAITAPVMIVSKDYVIERANIAFAEHCGLDITEVPGSTCHKLLAERDQPCAGCPMLNAIEDNGRCVSSLEHRARRKEFEASA